MFTYWKRESEHAEHQAAKDKLVERALPLGFTADELHRHPTVRSLEQGLLTENEAFAELEADAKLLQEMRTNIAGVFGDNWETELGHADTVKTLQTALRKRRNVDLAHLKAKYDRWHNLQQAMTWARERGITSFEPKQLDDFWKRAAVAHGISSRMPHLMEGARSLLLEKLLAVHEDAAQFKTLWEAVQGRFRDVQYNSIVYRVLGRWQSTGDLAQLSVPMAIDFLVTGAHADIANRPC